MGITNIQSAETATDNPRAVAGNNRPPVAIEAKSEFDERIDATDGLRQRIKDLIGASDRATATSEETMGKCGQTVIQIRAAMKKVTDAHTEAKAPYLEGGRVIDAAKNELHGQLSAAKETIEGKQQSFLREQKKRDDERRAKIEAEERRVQAENARIQREHDEAVRKAEQEAADAARAAEEAGRPVPVYVAPVIAAPVYVAPPAASQPIERGIIRGAEGAAISGKKVWKSKVINYSDAFKMVASNPKVREAVDTAIAAIVRAGVHEMEGVDIWEDVGVSNR